MSAGVKELTTPITEDVLRSLEALDRVELSGTVYTARDAAHARIVEAIEAGEAPPFELAGAVVYYVGPAPARPDSSMAVGSAGPTTSARMDPFMEVLLKAGLRATIGKGPRSRECAEMMVQHGAVYFGAVGGAGALLAGSIRSAEVVAYEDLGTEAVRRLEVEAMPLFVALDTLGRDAYRFGRESYLMSLRDGG